MTITRFGFHDPLQSGIFRKTSARSDEKGTLIEEKQRLGKGKHSMRRVKQINIPENFRNLNERHPSYFNPPKGEIASAQKLPKNPISIRYSHKEQV